MPRSERQSEGPGRGWTITSGRGPLVATAIHDGHLLRPEMAPRIALSPAERLREEDPWTALWTRIVPNRVVVHRSRFEVDMNRPRWGSVYRTPEEAWGLEVWREPLPRDVLERSWAEYDAFFGDVGRLLDWVAEQHGSFVVLDLHSYNHRRGGPDAPPDDPATNPDVNLGTGSMDRAFWAPVVEAFLQSMALERVHGRRLDVRENVRFQGGWFSRWVHETYPGQGGALAVEVKKIFMDEWTGRPDPAALRDVEVALRRAADAVRDALATLARGERAGRRRLHLEAR